ncbi:HesA/MoeB/ThiF family protein, partial [Candidatus Pelagibacter sp.]|nr:HesA/MoeB/ThiF family protein [Candidatus Pelagibacter sp.]
MNLKLNKNQLERFSRQIVLKNIGILGQKKIIQSKVLIIGMGGLGCPVAEFLTRAGVGSLGIVDSDNVDLSNIHRQSLYNTYDLKRSKVVAARRKLKKINSKIKISCHKIRINQNNYKRVIEGYDYIIDGSDNFKTKFLINDICKNSNKFLMTGAISKFDGHIFTFDFKKKNTPCIRSFFQEEKVSDDILNCEYEGILG